MGRMNKRELITETARRAGMRYTETEQIINSFLDVLGDELLTSGTVYLTGLGRLEVRVRSARTGRNPQTGERLELPATRLVGFKASKHLRKRLNQNVK